MPKSMQLSSDKKLGNRPPTVNEVGGNQLSRRLRIFDRTSHIRFLIDTGSDVSIIPASTREKLHDPSAFQLHAAN